MAGVSFALTETISAPVHAVFEYLHIALGESHCSAVGWAGVPV